MKLVFILFVSFAIINMCVLGKKHINKYTAEMNTPAETVNDLPQRVTPSSFTVTEKYDPDFRNIQKPFRMAKLNLVWIKAQHRLTEPKLKSLYTELKIQDKEELAWKQLSSQNTDKEGIKEAELRKKMIGIMSTYGLLEHFDDTENLDVVKHNNKGFSGPYDGYKNKSIFKDKKLNRLWEKAEVAGFTTEELNALKEEFMHHQEKIDMYYSLLDNIDIAKKDQHENAVNEEEMIRFNEIELTEDAKSININPNVKKNDYVNEANLLREKHRDIRDNIDRLERIAAKGPNSKDFIEPKVQSLWRIAANSNFTVDELASLKTELLHYESRLLKLRHLHAEHALNKEKYKNAEHGHKHDKNTNMEDHIKKQTRKVEKLHENIEKRIFRHTEL